MKYITIEQFSQESLCKYGLTGHDAIILKWFLIFTHSPTVEKIWHQNQVYYWIAWTHIQRCLPAIPISSPRVYQKKFAKYVKLGLLQRYIMPRKKKDQTRAFFAPTDKLLDMIASNFDKTQDTVNNRLTA
jgi:hypothetical protein